MIIHCYIEVLQGNNFFYLNKLYGITKLSLDKHINTADQSSKQGYYDILTTQNGSCMFNNEKMS